MLVMLRKIKHLLHWYEGHYPRIKGSFIKNKQIIIYLYQFNQNYSTFTRDRPINRQAD